MYVFLLKADFFVRSKFQSIMQVNACWHAFQVFFWYFILITTPATLKSLLAASVIILNENVLWSARSTLCFLKLHFSHWNELEKKRKKNNKNRFSNRQFNSHEIFISLRLRAPFMQDTFSQLFFGILLSLLFFLEKNQIKSILLRLNCLWRGKNGKPKIKLLQTNATSKQNTILFQISRW